MKYGIKNARSLKFIDRKTNEVKFECPISQDYELTKDEYYENKLINNKDNLIPFKMSCTNRLGEPLEFDFYVTYGTYLNIMKFSKGEE